MDDQTSEAPATEVAGPESDAILSALSDEQSEESDTKPEESEEARSEESVKTTDNPAEQDASTLDEEEESSSEDKNQKSEQELDPEESRKAEARRRYEERERVRAERRARVEEHTRDYVDSAEDETDKRIRAIEVQRYNEIVENNENVLINDFDKAKTNPDLQIFNPDSDQFNQKLYEKAIKDFHDGQIVYDDNGNMVKVKGSLYKHLTEMADIFHGAIRSGEFQQVRAQRKMTASADIKPVATPKATKKDPIMEVLTSDD